MKVNLTKILAVTLVVLLLSPAAFAGVTNLWLESSGTVMQGETATAFVGFQCVSDYDLTVNIEDTYGSVVETLIDRNSMTCGDGSEGVHSDWLLAEIDGSMTASLEGDYEIVSY